MIISADKAVSSGMKICKRLQNRAYNIPRMPLLSDHVKQDKIEDYEVVIKVRDYGEQTKVFTSDQEATLTERIIHLSKRGFSLNTSQFRQIAFEYALELKWKGLTIDVPPLWS